MLVPAKNRECLFSLFYTRQKHPCSTLKPFISQSDYFILKPYDRNYEVTIRNDMIITSSEVNN